MPVLTEQQLDERIALYTAYREAVAKLNGLAKALPVEPPRDFAVSWGNLNDRAQADEEVEFAPRARVRFVVKRAWPSLRAAVLKDAEKELADAEQAVLKFEAGDEVAAPQEKPDGDGA